MSITGLGKVRASGGRSREVKWDEKTGEIYVEGSPGIFGSGEIKKIGIQSRDRLDILNIAQTWLESNSSR